MATPDIKVGEFYNLKMLCILKEEKVIVFETPSGDHIPLRQCDLECVTPIPSEPPTLVGTTPKHDPCRKFRKGDIVEPCAVNGRWCSHVWEDRSGIHYEVTKDEDPLTAHMEVKDPDSPYSFLVHAAFFKLVTPVEEISPYYVEETASVYEVCNRNENNSSVAIFFKSQYSIEKAKERAEAERDRLNAEYRKEMEK